MTMRLPSVVNSPWLTGQQVAFFFAFEDELPKFVGQFGRIPEGKRLKLAPVHRSLLHAVIASIPSASEGTSEFWSNSTYHIRMNE
jgi:hypothetical protein